MWLLKRWILPMTCGFIGLSCCQFLPPKREAALSFYYWKQTPMGWNEDTGDYETPNDFSPPAFSHLGAKRVYVKFFDIDWRVGNGAYPRQRFEAIKPLPTLDLVPTFYILNRVFEKSDSSDIENLAAHIVKVVGVKYSEIQMDCDWTATTRDAYFQYLKTLRRQLAPSVKSAPKVAPEDIQRVLYNLDPQDFLRLLNSF